ncbi:WW domain-containing oxidoreductase [Neocloeon triangulifer]|uniref:WW domain-containing oxidoreductase n=1 Tax=Neocloeon triangulifer TaxID=2078957 RepID=UPI00286EEE77|nr:WW domain-containing oxidoreductase [Neocloeon triangulifer]XP_059485944.1 WW domain-containing oxidoreductase [Neocloeon triangulifer]
MSAAVLPDSDSEDELPPGWEERAMLDGRVYFVNHNTKGCQWTHPRTGKRKVVAGEIPFGWTKQVTEDGKVLYVDDINKRSTYADPRLAFALEEKETPDDFRQKFDGSCNAMQVLHGRDLTNKVAIITGANCGIGFETARSLALHGCTTIFACRDPDRAQEAIGKIKAEGRSTGPMEFMELDLASLKSVKNFATLFQINYKTLDMLILNAAVMGLPFSLTPDGFETHFQVNHLSHFYLTLLLKPVLLRTICSRVVFVSSESHRFSFLGMHNISEERLSAVTASRYQGAMQAYNDSKLCNLIISVEIARRWSPLGIAVNALHPGNMVSSDLARHWWLYRLIFSLVRPFTKSLQQAASTSVYVAAHPDTAGVGGLYFNNCCRCPSSAACDDVELALALWDLSVAMIEKVMGQGATTEFTQDNTEPSS